MAAAMFEFLIPQRPVSTQTRRRENLREWKNYVAGEAAKAWPTNLNSSLSPDLQLPPKKNTTTGALALEGGE